MRPEEEEEGKTEESFSLEDILAEYKLDATLKPSRRKNQAEQVDVSLSDPAIEANQKLEKLLAEMKSQQNQDTKPLPSSLSVKTPMSDEAKIFGNPLASPPPPAPKADSGVLETHEINFGTTQDFSQVFAPSNDFMGQDSLDDLERMPDEGAPPPRESFWKRIASRAKRLAPEQAEVTPAMAAEKLTPYVRSLTLRTMAAFLLLLPLLYATFAHRLDLPFPNGINFLTHTYYYLLFVLVFQFLVMFCGIDVLARGMADLFRLRPTMDTGVAVACIASTLHVFSMLLYGNTYYAYVPYCSVSAFSVFLALWSARLRFGARLRTYHIAKNAAPSHVISMEDRLWEDVAGVTKREVNLHHFVEQTELHDNVERFFNFFMPIALIASLVLAFLVSVGMDDSKRFFWAWSAIVSCIMPFTALFAFVLPFNVVSRRIATVGAAIAGWTAARQVAKASVCVLTDSDVFPANTVSLNGLKVFGNHSFDKVISYATSVVSASGSGLSRAFSELLKGNLDAIRRVTDFQHYEGGGMGAYVSNDRVMVGSYNFMVSMSISMPRELNIKDAVFISINMEMAGIFAINYTPLNSVKSSLHMLGRHDMLPLFAVRDFNLTAPNLKSRFKLTDDQLDFPVIEERLLLSDTQRPIFAKPIAVTSKEGLLPYAECVVGSLSLRKTARLNLVLSVICAIVGMFIMYYLTFSGSAATAAPANVLLYQVLWTVPTFLISGWAGRY